MVRPARAVRAALVAAASLAACTDGGGVRDRELGGLVTAARPAAPPDPARAARDPDELGRLLARPWTRAASGLGPHRLTVRSAVEVKDGAQVVEHLDDTTSLELGDGGAFHATLDNSAGYGREVVWLGGALYQRPRYARWHKRGPETDDEPAAIADQLAATLGDYYALVARGVELSARPPTQEAGRPAVPVALALAPRPRPARPEPLRQRSWRDEARVSAVGGELVLDQATGAALRGKLTGAVDFVRAGRALTMSVEVEWSVALGPQAITPPADEQVVTTPTRLREVDDRNALLRGLAPTVGKAAVDPTTGEAPTAGATTGAGAAGGKSP